jgi:hypothetical protein
MRFRLDAPSGGMKIKIPYPIAGSIQVSADGVAQPYTAWDDALGAPGELQKTQCGENRFVGVENYLEFYITPDCEIGIEPRDAIMTTVRLQWSLDEFYEDGGVTTFVDRLAASLGIESYQIKTISVYQGSVIIEYIITAPDDMEEDMVAETLDAIKTDMVEQTQ